jgi:hypothetical protein
MKMQWSKYSNLIIEVSKTFCPSCEKQFFEIDGYELQYCPYCEADLGTCDYDSQVNKRIYADFMTGKISINDLIEELPKAIKTTEQPSKAAAVEGILTEEELHEIDCEIYSSLDRTERAMLEKLISSHRLLLSANAELSFKNNLLDGAHCELLAENTKLWDAKKTYEKALGLIADVIYEGPVGALKWRDIANDALEAFDHE